MVLEMAEKKTDEKRYDRQLRLWGEVGQGRLENARICLLNCTATGTETLKNLVLPGIGHFTVVDGKKVDESDLTNFFVEHGSLGKSRASVVRDLLVELNDLVHGEFVERDPVELIEKDPKFFTSFTLIIANNIPEGPLLKLASICWDHSIPLFSVRAYGLVGYLRIQTPEHTIVESKPDNPSDDLRITSPFPTLKQYAESVNLDTMDSTEHSHTPYIVLLIKYLEQWKNTHAGKLPSTYAEKSEFRNIVIKGSRKTDEENFGEAYKVALKACLPYTIPSSTLDILRDAKAAELTANSDKFWILAHAVRGFVDNEGAGALPLTGSLPDMAASTESYLQLQHIYQSKAAEDVAAVTVRVKNALQQIGKTENFITGEEIKTFCKNAHFLGVIRYRSLAQEYTPSTAKASLLASLIAAEEGDPNRNINWYLALRASDKFYSQHGHYPGSSDAQVASDTKTLVSLSASLLKELNLSDVSVDESSIQEIVRFGAAELHPIAAFLGGIASQEVIKVVTHMYTPMDNTFIFNGINSTSLTVSL